MEQIELRPAAPDQKPVIANLIQLYLYDMTEFMPFPVGADGHFEYGFLDRFWRYPYLIMSGDEIAGFALVIDECPLTGTSPCWFMAEFFVMRAYRQRGVGREAVRLAISRHPGQWHLGVPHANRAALAFWSNALKAQGPTVSDLQHDGDHWRLHTFQVP
ncbi:GNAT family N-acetyltransferase [Devosia albogilva]|uniref:GNAT family N-acetyltransferase n=1 Tax=Devosia albogilva TaxID=429726 RepID=A0ABW5QN09_9HYPH